MSQISRRSTLVVVALIASCTLGGLAAAIVTTLPEPKHEDVVPTAYASQFTQFESETPDAAIANTLKGLDGDVIESVRLGSPPPRDDDETPWLYAVVKSKASYGGAAVSAQWEADLAQGAVADRIAVDGATDLADVIAGSSVTLELPDGTTEDLGGGAGDIRPGQLFADQDMNLGDADISQRVRGILDKFGLAAVEIRVLRPLGPAVYVVASADKASDLDGSYDAIRAAILDDPVRYEGLYLEVDLPDGTPIVRGAQALRSGAGTLWIAPGLDDAVGANHG